MQIVREHVGCSFAKQIFRKQTPQWKIRCRINEKTSALYDIEEKNAFTDSLQIQFIYAIDFMFKWFIYLQNYYFFIFKKQNLKDWRHHCIWIPFISLRTCLTKLYTTTLRCLYVILYTEQTDGENVFILHTTLSHQLTKESQQDYSLFPTESCGLCEAAPLFVEKHFSFAECSLCP